MNKIENDLLQGLEDIPTNPQIVINADALTNYLKNICTIKVVKKDPRGNHVAFATVGAYIFRGRIIFQLAVEKKKSTTTKKATADWLT